MRLLQNDQIVHKIRLRTAFLFESGKCHQFSGIGILCLPSTSNQ